MCQFVETIRIDHRGVLRLSYHNARLNATCQHFWPGSEMIRLEEYLHPLPDTGPVEKCRVVYGEAGVTEVIYAGYAMKPVHSLRLVHADELDYTYKKVDREPINRLLAARGDQDDILIVKHGLLTDTSIANIALWDGSCWFTPKTPLLKGSHRAFLLDQGIIREKDITSKELFSFTAIRLFNAMIEWGAMELPVISIYNE